MSFVKKGLLVSSAGILQMGIGVMQVMLLSRGLGPDGVGQLAMYRQVFLFSVQIAALGLPMAMINSVNKQKENLSRAFSSTLYPSLIPVVMAAAVNVVLICTVPKVFGTPSLLLCIGACLYIVLLHVRSVFYNLQVILLNAREMAVILIAPTIVYIGILAVLFLCDCMVVDQVVVIEACTLMGLGCFLGMWHARKALVFLTTPSVRILRNTFKLGTQIVAADMGSLFNGTVTLVILRLAVEDFEEIGYFSRGLVLATMVLRIVGTIVRLLYSKWAQLEGEALRNSVHTTINVTFTLALALSTVVILLTTPIVLVLFGEQFLPSVPVTRIMIIGVGGFVIAQTLQSLFNSDSKPVFNILVFLVGILVNVPLALVFAPRYQAMGSAGAMLASYLAMTTTSLVIAKLRYGLSLRALLLPSPRLAWAVYRQFRRKA